MPQQDNDIYRNYNFVLKIQGQDTAYFTEVSGLSIDVETIEYREGGGAPAVRKLPGRVKYGDVTLKWGLTRNRELTDWLNNVAQGNVEPRDIHIVLRKPNGIDEATRWILHGAWPCSWRGAQLSAKDNDVAIESMVLTHEGLERGTA
jgi:phage tail-like protein